MNERQFFVELRDILAYLYPEATDARRVVNDAGMDAGNVSFEPKAINNWTAILYQAEKERKTAKLMAVTSKDYPENEKLSNSWHNYLIAVGGKEKDKPFELTPNHNTRLSLGLFGLVAIIIISIGMLLRWSPLVFGNLMSPAVTATSSSSVFQPTATAEISMPESKPEVTFTSAPEASTKPLSLDSVSVSSTLTSTPQLLDLNLSSPFVDGLQLKVTKIEILDGSAKVEIVAQYQSIGLAPFGPRLYDYGEEGKQQEKAELEEQKWRTLESSEFIFQDQEGYTYTVNSTGSMPETEIIPGGKFKGFLTLHDLLESSVSQLSLIYSDDSHGVPIIIDGIPIPQKGVTTTNPQQDNPMAECGFITSSSQLTAEGQRKRDEEWLKSLPLDVTPVPTQIPSTQDVSLQSDKLCGISLSIQRVTKNQFGIVTLEMTLNNDDLPYNLSLFSLPIKVTGSQQTYTMGMYDEIRDKSNHPIQVTLHQLPSDIAEVAVSLTLPGKQVITINNVPLPLMATPMPIPTPINTDMPVLPTSTNTDTSVPPTPTDTDTPMPPMPTNTDTPVPPILTDTPSPANGRKGDWVGQTEQGQQIAFRVTEDPISEAVANIDVSFQYVPPCSLGLATFSSFTSGHIFEELNNSFNILQIAGSSNTLAHVRGGFKSNVEAEGTLEVVDQRLNAGCPPVFTVRWTAKKVNTSDTSQ